jgi:SAM-dependent methyltransferase
MLTALRPTAGHLLRLLAHRSPLSPLARRVLAARGGPREHETAEYWNEEAPRLCTAFNGRLGNDLRNQAIAVMIRSLGPRPRRVLELGCAFGDLADVLEPGGLQTYLGVDLSDRVVGEAQRRPAPAGSDARRRFVSADLRAFAPDDEERFEVIVFNEVLYYLPVDEAVRQVRRFDRWLASDGVICVSMKKQPKSEAITALLRRTLDWVYGTLLQQQPDGPAYRVRRDPARPAYLIGLMRPRRSTLPPGPSRPAEGGAGGPDDSQIR